MNTWSRSERKLASDERESERFEYIGWRGRRREVGSNGRSPSKIER